MKTIYAVLVGINNYPTSPLYGCINDVLAVHAHFEKLCANQSPKINWQPIFYLAPHADEVLLLQEKGIDFKRPTRNNLISAFQYFKKAEKEDYCLWYYSGHGSYIGTHKMPMFEDYEPSGELQSLVCLDEDEKVPTLYHLMDKELGFLIADAMNERESHFLSIMDCCHSGSNTRSDESQVLYRMHSGKTTIIPEKLHGFTKNGNCFYLPFKEGQEKVQAGGLTSAKHISLAAAQSSESAYEMPSKENDERFKGKRHGVFTVSLLKALEQSGTQISYAELMEKVRMEVKGKVDNQIPMLDAMDLEDANLYFLKNQFSPVKETYSIFFRAKSSEWIVNAGAINGISKNSKFKLTDGTGRVVVTKNIGPSESILDERQFIDSDKSNLLLEATLFDGDYSKIKIGFSNDLNESIQSKIKTLYQKEQPKYFEFENDISQSDYQIHFENENFIIRKSDSSLNLNEPDFDPKILLRDLEKIGKFEFVTHLNNPDSTIPLDDFQIDIHVLEGVPFSASTLNEIPLSSYKKIDFPVEKVEANFSQVDEKMIQPAIKVKVTCLKPMKAVYWIGALYCDAQFGITDQYLQIQQIGKYQTDQIELEFRMERQGKILKWQSIPLSTAPEWKEQGVHQIKDSILIFISDANQPFSLKSYCQEKVTFSSMRGASFLDFDLPVEESWGVIKFPLCIYTAF